MINTNNFNYILFDILLSIIDRCGSPLCVLYSPKTVAGAALLLASEFSSEALENAWWDQIDLDGSIIHGNKNIKKK